MPENRRIHNVQRIVVLTGVFTVCCFIFYGNRSSFLSILIPFFILGALSFVLSFHERYRLRKVNTILLAGILLRIPFLFSEPILSDDYHRFIWDAKLAVETDIHPYQYRPEELKEMADPFYIRNADLYEKLNSKSFYSVYGPLNQFLFQLPVVLSKHPKTQLFIFHLLILIAEILFFFLLQKMQTHSENRFSPLAVYFLNPLVIVELCGNLHFEGWSILLLFSALFYLRKAKLLPMILYWIAAITMKFIPLLVLPFVRHYLSWKQSFVSGLSIIILSGIIMYGYAGEYILGWTKSIGLFVQQFEFNASFHYLLRGTGNQLLGFNPLLYTGPVLLVFLCIFLVYLALRKPKNTLVGLYASVLVFFTFYYGFSSIVHPWYLIPLLAFAALLELKSFWWWTTLSFLSYSFYSYGEGQIYYAYIGLEYALFVILLFSERKSLVSYLKK